MGNNPSFSDFLANTSSEIDLFAFTINFFLTAIIIYVVARVYVKYGSAVSNRRAFSNNLILVSVITMLIITVVKSSLALSLGLVGALSIVRFRAPIKEPEELAYLFLSIAIGLGFGAGQRATTIIGALLILIIAILMKTRKAASASENDIYLSISAEKTDNQLLDTIISLFEKFDCKVNLKRVDEKKDSLKVDFLVSFEDYDKLSRVKEALIGLNDTVRISMIDNRLLQ